MSIKRKSQLVERLRNDQPVGLIEEMKKRPCGVMIAVHEMRKAIRFGAQDENRTHDLRITSALLYP
jgi:hypothetical protein